VTCDGPELVCRAVQLVLDGALDDGTEQTLGRRLGISARHLRRLSIEHLGVTLDQLARSRRAHFARRLLDDTDLTVTEIAFAAGFGSVRQLNRACRELFRATPTALRARRRSTDRLVADGGLVLRLPFAGPLAWDEMLGYARGRAIAGVEHVDEHTYRRTVLIDGDPGVIELARGGPEHLVLRAHLPHWEGVIHIAQRARRIFCLDADLESAIAHLEGDTKMRRLVRLRPGIRPMGTWDPFETGVRAIVGQQVTVTAANTIARRLVTRFGVPVPGLVPLGLTHLFPGPSALAEADLETIGLTSSRAATVRAFAGAVDADALSLDRGQSLQALLAALVELPGLGPWTAHYVALRLGQPDAFPSADAGIRRALASMLDEPVSARRAEDHAAGWSPWRAYAAAQLWSSLPAARPAKAAPVIAVAPRESGPEELEGAA
jgi:AraC family transcriptional regulator of adaptative response / DNA-3-methyladenine glycosylase II